MVERKAINFTGTTFTVAAGDSGDFTPFLAGTAPVSTRPGFTDITFTFDRDSNVISRVDEAGNVIVSTLDGLSRRTALNITPAEGFIGTTQQAWTFDGLSRQKSSFDNNEPNDPNDDVATADFYDSLSRLLEEQQQIGLLPPKAVSYQFDIAVSNSVFQSSALVYPDGRQVNNVYDNLDRLLSRTDNGQSSAIGTVQYIGVGRVATLTFQNKTRLSYFAGTTDVGYDALRRVVNHRWETSTPSTPLGSGSLLVGFGYTYDRANNRLSQEKLHDPGNSELYSYRSDYELTSFARGTLNGTKTAVITPTGTTGALQNQTWSLDGTGNWTANTHTTGGITGTENRSHSNVNEIATLSGSPYGSNVNFTNQYDNNGNLLDDGLRLYKWDALNRLQQVFRKSDGLLIADYSYGADNRRFRKVVSNGGLDGSTANGTTDFYWSGWQTIEERDALDLVTQQYVYGMGLNELWTLDDRRIGILVAQLNDGLLDERKFYQTDSLGSVYALSNETGQIVVGFQYDAYGVPTEFGQGLGGLVTFGSNVVTVGTTVPANPYLYAGYRHDGETFLFYVANRYYSPEQGRFISRDPIAFAGGYTNLYVYVGNSPTNFVDPSGLYKPSHPYCVRLRERISNVEANIHRRIGQLHENPQNLPEVDPGDDVSPGLSKRGHRRLINEDKALLAALKAEYLANCSDQDPPCPPVVPIPIPVPATKPVEETSSETSSETVRNVVIVVAVVVAVATAPFWVPPVVAAVVATAPITIPVTAVLLIGFALFGGGGGDSGAA